MIGEGATRHAIPIDGLFFSVLMKQVSVADSSYLPWNEAYEHSVSLSMGNTFFKNSVKDDSVPKYCVYFFALCLLAD
jgi:hypothetical protein